jgi:small subunit ribosomal protein S2
MNLQYGGIKEMVQRPAIVFVIDVTHDKNAVNEAKKLNIPVVGLVDTNADPTGIAYPIPSNDDAVKTIQLMLDYVKQAINNGKSVAQKSADKQETK